MYPTNRRRRVPRAVRRAARRVDVWDREVTGRIAASQWPPLAERGLPALTRAADRSVLWFSLAAAMALSGRRDLRRAAVRGAGNIAVTSLVANQLAKRAVPRQRPLISGIPVRRHARRMPTSSSFPSGHTASAAAFCVGASVEAPWLVAPLGLLAGAVGFSRIYTGAHYTSDVLAGAALGAGIAALGSRIVPGHEEPRRPGTEPGRPQPARTDGKGLVAVLNRASGTADEELRDALAAELPDAEIVEVGEGEDLLSTLRAAAGRADVLGVAGGDGTINCAARVAMDADVPLLVFPGGTFNHFARDLDLCTTADSIEALRAGRAVRIDVGDANGEIFLNTASLGSYPEFVRVRESLEHRFGKRVAAAVAIVRVARGGPGFDAVVDGRRTHALLLFVGNGCYRPTGLVPRWRPALDTGLLDVRWVDGSRRWSLVSLLAAALSGNAYRPRSYRARTVETLHVDVDGERGLLARDGEVSEAPTPVRFSVRRQALTVYRGAPPGGESTGPDGTGSADSAS